VSGHGLNSTDQFSSVVIPSGFSREESAVARNWKLENLFPMNRDLAFFLFLSIAVFGCRKSTPSAESREAPPQSPAVQAITPAPASSGPSSPAQPAEIEAVAKRIFGDAAVVAPRAQFITGDFNGDGYEDLAFSVRASKQIVQENATGLANWIAEDPAHIQLPALGKSVQPLPPAPPPVHLRAGEALTAVVHGMGPRGWRDPQARQTFLLVGNLPENPTALPISRFPQLANDPRFTHLPRQVICGAEQRCLFWTGAWYAVHTAGASSR
jgi:hypothetical protein